MLDDCGFRMAKKKLAGLEMMAGVALTQIDNFDTHLFVIIKLNERLLFDPDLANFG
jgi:hypothetical protein